MSCVAPSGILWHNRYGLQCKKRVVDRVADQVETHLNIVKKLVQPSIDDFLDLNIVELRAKTTEMLLGGIGKCARGSAGNRMERSLCRDHAVVNRSREFAVENEEFDNPVRRNLLESFPIHF